MTEGLSNERALEEIRLIASKQRGRVDQLIQVLKDIQPLCGNTITEEIVAAVAREMDIPVARVFEIASFYAFFSFEKRGKYVIRLCKSAPCHVKGAKALVRAFEEALGVKAGQTTPDGLFTLETCECLGICDRSPAALINDDAYGPLTPDMVEGVLYHYREEA